MNGIVFDWQKDGLTGLGIKPADTRIEKMIVLLHGYMGDAESNMEFAHTLAGACQNAVVLVPNGLSPVPDMNDEHHRQWWPLIESNGAFCAFMPYFAPKEMQKNIKKTVKEMHKTAVKLNKFILNSLKEYGLSLPDCFVAGISQGGMTAFEMVLFCDELYGTGNNDFLGGFISIGSGITGADRLRDRTIPPIPVLLTRGRRDDIFPKTVDYFSQSLLKEQHVPVDLKEADSVHFGLEHAVADEVCRFIARHC